MSADKTASDLHHHDGSHRWVPPDPTISQEGWAAQVRAHIEDAQAVGGCQLLPGPQVYVSRPAHAVEGGPGVGRVPDAVQEN